MSHYTQFKQQMALILYTVTLLYDLSTPLRSKSLPPVI